MSKEDLIEKVKQLAENMSEENLRDILDVWEPESAEDKILAKLEEIIRKLENIENRPYWYYPYTYPYYPYKTTYTYPPAGNTTTITYDGVSSYCCTQNPDQLSFGV
jgi:hypothetical protein